MSEIVNIKARGFTIFMIEHDMRFVMGLCERIAVLNFGRIIAEGTLAELRALFPPTTVEYVEKQPTLEEIFLAIVGSAGPLSEEES